MGARTINAKEAVRDIRAGLDNAALKKKYHLSDQGLQVLFAKLKSAGLLDRPGKTVFADDILADIRLGMGQSDLMNKHGLSSRGLQGLVSLLLDSGAINREDLYFHETPDAVMPDNVRSQERYYLDFDTLVYDEARPEIHGKVVDVTEEGVGLQGIEAHVDEIKTLVVLGDPFGESFPFEFRAICRWARRADDDTQTAGFQIVKIAPKDLEELRKLIRLVTFTG